MDTKETRYLNLFSVLIASLLFVLVWLITDYQVTAYNQQEKQKVAVLSKQIASRLEVFFASRVRALDEIATNWPESHPNRQLWFTSFALSVHGVLPGIQSILYSTNDELPAWQSPVNSVDQSELAQLNLSQLPKLKPPHSYAKQLNNGENVMVLTRPLDQRNEQKGRLYALINLDVTVYFLLSEHLQGNYNLEISDGVQTLFMHGLIHQNQVSHTESILVVDHPIQLRLSSNQSYQTKDFILISGILLAIFISWLSRAALKNRVVASKLEKQYRAASNASLDGLLIFREDNQRFVLSGINRVGERYTGLFKTPEREFVFYDLLIALGLQIDAELRRAPHYVLKGETYEKQVRVSSPVPEIGYLKLQMVRMSTGFAVTLRNITSRVIAERELKSREEKYSRLVNGLRGHFLYSLNQHGNLDYVSSSVENILGFSPSYMVENFNRHLVKNELYHRRNDLIARLLEGHPDSRSYLLEIHDADSKVRVIEFLDTPVYDEFGALIAIEGIAKDITSEKEMQGRIEFQANHDALTGLFNRYAFDHQLEKVVSLANQQNIEAAFCYIDLDRFKVVNDSQGHVAGDQLLKQLGSLLNHQLKDAHFLARLGGDEFGILFTNCDMDEAYQYAKRLLNEINVFRFVWRDEIFQIGASVGLTRIQSGMTATDVMTAADTACYYAKDMGRNRVQIYQDNDEELNYHKSRVGWVQKIKQALEHERFELHMQTIKPLAGDTQVGRHYEVLIRMREESGELVSPALFIPVAERFDLMQQIDAWVIQRVLQAFSDDPQLYFSTEKCAINLSGNSITDEEFADDILAMIADYRLEPSKICFEITETAAVTKLNSANAFIAKLRAAGCKFALDDFGAGMCSFAYLKNLPVDYVKIDGGFVKNMCQQPSDEAIVRSINDIAHSLGKETIAEFVADGQTEARLVELGINYVQGFYIDEPKPMYELANVFSLESKQAS